MPAGKMDGQIGADTANADSSGIFVPKRCFHDHQAPDQLSALSREQNPAAQRRVCSPERTSECQIRSVCCSSSPNQTRASGSRASPGVQAAAELPSTSDGYRVAGPREIEPDPRSPGTWCP